MYKTIFSPSETNFESVFISLDMNRKELWPTIEFYTEVKNLIIAEKKTLNLRKVQNF